LSRIDLTFLTKIKIFYIILLKMKILILGEWEYKRLSATMEKLIEDSQCYLFTIVSSPAGIGRKWAVENGSGLEIWTETADKLVDYIDYVVAFGDSQEIKNFIMKIKMQGKHGIWVKE
jgi:hypothetical protein